MEKPKLDLECERLTLIKEGKLCDSEESAHGGDNSGDIFE